MGTIFDIKRCALHDGPGLRTTVFLKGCPLSCLGCHNPEGQGVLPELLFRPDRCTGCGDCVDVCPNQAITLAGKTVTVDRGRCDLTGACTEACLPGALELVGREASVDEILEVLEKDRVFFEESGGGVTFSGGDPFSQPDFLEELMEECRRREIPIVLDTCGHVAPETFRRLAPRATHLLFDLKLMDPDRHQAFTGVPNRWILDNLGWVGNGCTRDLDAREGGAGKGAGNNGGTGNSAGQCPSITVRVPLIPGINDDAENLSATAEFVAELSTRPPVDILPYHRLGVDKYQRTGREYRLSPTQPPRGDVIRDAVRLLKKSGLSVTVRGDPYDDD